MPRRGVNVRKHAYTVTVQNKVAEEGGEEVVGVAPVAGQDEEEEGGPGGHQARFAATPTTLQ